MGVSKKSSKEDHAFISALRRAKVPVLVLDQKWHRLFSDGDKPEAVEVLERRLNELLMRQGHLQQEIKDLKKLKNTLMHNIVENMDGAEGKSKLQTKKLSEDRRLIDEINERLVNSEDELLELPKRMKEANEALMIESMEYCYDKLKVNERDIEEIGEWIKNVRIELKKQVIRKQNAELKYKEMYSYLHDIFGAKVIDLFDLKKGQSAAEQGEEEN